MKSYILSLDQGTSSSRTILFDQNAQIQGINQIETKQFYPHRGWVEQDPIEIFNAQIKTLKYLIKDKKIPLSKIKGIGITNQRESTILWNKATGKPVYNAIIWQDNRTSAYCKSLKEKGEETVIRKKTGLVIDSYFSATKIKWILENVPEARILADKNLLLFGTIDTWILWNLTNGKVHATDYSNASRTLLFNINSLEWDEDLLNLFNIPKNILPQVKPSSYHFGNFDLENYSIPICGIAGDQQAALFGQACFTKGESKNTYGTGSFLLLNTGNTPKLSKFGLLTTIAWGIGNKVTYALEGSVFVSGAAIKWLRDELNLIKTVEESEKISDQIKDDYSVFVVPAFSGLGAPYWDMNAKGAIFGLTQNTGKEQIVKATLESLAYQSKDLILAMQEDAQITISSLKVDGGASSNNYLLQFQSDILSLEVERAKIIESTALGVAYLAGIEIGIWTMEEILKKRKIDKTFKPKMNPNTREFLYKKWKNAIERTKDWDAD